MEICESDQFSDSFLVDCILTLRNVPVEDIPDDEPRRCLKRKEPAKRRVQKPRPKRLPEEKLDSAFLVNPPHKFIMMANGDERFKIPYTYMEAYSSGNPERYRAMMKEVCAPNLVFMQHYDGKQNPYGPNQRVIEGVEDVTNFWLACMRSAPDMIPTIYDAPVGYRSEQTEESFLSVKVICSMTKTSLVMDENQLNGCIDKLACIDLKDEKPEDKDGKSEFKLMRLPAHVPIVTSYQCCKYSMVLTPEHKITKLCMLFKVVMGDPSTAKY